MKSLINFINESKESTNIDPKEYLNKLNPTKLKEAVEVAITNTTKDLNKLKTAGLEVLINNAKIIGVLIENNLFEGIKEGLDSDYSFEHGKPDTDQPDFICSDKSLSIQLKTTKRNTITGNITNTNKNSYYIFVFYNETSGKISLKDVYFGFIKGSDWKTSSNNAQLSKSVIENLCQKL